MLGGPKNVKETTTFLDETTFSEAIAVPRAILFIHCEWSKMSVVALERFECWEQERQMRPDILRIPIFKVQPDILIVRDWLESQDRGDLLRTGYGEVLWLEHGKIVEVMSYWVVVYHMS